MFYVNTGWQEKSGIHSKHRPTFEMKCKQSMPISITTGRTPNEKSFPVNMVNEKTTVCQIVPYTDNMKRGTPSK